MTFIYLILFLLIISLIKNYLQWKNIVEFQNKFTFERNRKDELKEEHQKLRMILKEKNLESDKFQYKTNSELYELKEKNKLLEECINKKDRLFEDLKDKSDTSISRITSLYSDFLTLQFDISSSYLKRKKRPAKKEAKRIIELKQTTRLQIEKYRQMLYKYETLLQLFPELTNFVDDFESLNQLEEANSIDDFKEDFDKVQNYISKEEYLKLDIDERNQLALDRYLNGKKTNWQIGRDYELYCGLLYERLGWKVEYFGMEKKLKDLGRDLIARKEDQVKIIQCKLWKKSSQIHEKHILQLYGTTIIEKISEQDFFTDFEPVFITSTDLSETALKFAKILNVKVEKVEMKDFPRIKCNVGKDEFGNTTKIYHLPFDQHYDRTRIVDGKGFYAKDVKEASSKGFRRAYKYRPTTNAT